MQRLKVERIEGQAGWWLMPHDPPIGPYDTVQQAREAKPGIVAFWKNWLKPGFVSCEGVVGKRASVNVSCVR